MAFLGQRMGLSRYEADEYYKVGLAAYTKGKFDEAIINLTDAINALPKNAEYYAARGFVYLEDGITDKAEEDFEQALKLYPYELLAHYGRGIIAFQTKNWDEAQAHFTDAYRADPKRPETLYYLALVHHRKRENQIALRVMRNAHTLFESAGDKRRTDASKWVKTLESLVSSG